MGKYKDLADQIGQLVDEKNAAYGSSFEQAGDFLKLLYPNGIPVESYTDMLCVVRIFDKLKRIATKKDAFGESPYSDLVGYGLLGLHKDLQEKKTLEKTEPEVFQVKTDIPVKFPQTTDGTYPNGVLTHGEPVIRIDRPVVTVKTDEVPIETTTVMVEGSLGPLPVTVPNSIASTELLGATVVKTYVDPFSND
jgi:hypothetical protein